MKIESGTLNKTGAHVSSLLMLILLVASVLRLWGLTAFSLSNDELSALSRLQFDSVAEVIEQGVYVDFHPAGVQLFLYYWTMVFGFSEIAVRLPFALMGIGSVYFVYRIGHLWFGHPSGLLAAAAIAVLEYPVLYSQIARPYSPGLFFSLLATFFWTSALFKKNEPEDKANWTYFLGFALTVSACMYIHYFSFIFAGLLCFAGLFFLRKTTLLPYLIAGGAIVLLYIPHIDIFFHQLSKGGVGGSEGWLGPPGDDALGRYLDYCFNDSSRLKLLYFIIVSGTILLYRKEVKLQRFHLLALLFFATPFAIAYYYSIWNNPVFQFSVLLFSFPYLLLLLFSFIHPSAGSLTVRFLVVVVLAGGFYSTVYEKHYYSTPHFTEFRGIANRVKELDTRFGGENITKTISVFSPYYINYYLEKTNHNANFKLTSVMSAEERKQFRKIVEESKSPYYLHAFSNVYDDPRFDLIIRSKYPWVLLRDSMLNSGLRFYSREKSDSALNRLPVFSIQYGFEKGEWTDEIQFQDSVTKYEGDNSAFIPGDKEYGPGFMKKIADIGIEKGSVVELSAVIYSKNPLEGAKLVLSIENNGISKYWIAGNAEDYAEPGKWSRVFLAGIIPDSVSPDDEIKIYFWNQQKENFYTDDFRMNVYSPR